MEPAAGIQRRSSQGPAVPPPPRGHAPPAAAPGPARLSSPAREPPQLEEERQVRISESGQFSDGLEDRGERLPPCPAGDGGGCSGPASPHSRAALDRAPGSAPWSARGRGARTSRRGRGEPRAAAPPSAAGTASAAFLPFPRSPDPGCLQADTAWTRALLSASSSPSCARGKSLREAFFFAFGAERSWATAGPAQLGGTRARCILLSVVPCGPAGCLGELPSAGIAASCPSAAVRLPAPAKGARRGASRDPGRRRSRPESRAVSDSRCGPRSRWVPAPSSDDGAEDWDIWIRATNLIWMDATEI
ncbi:hypothetical protein P7K49_014186 [Saguinus oedipus]|uniref:Uncharacterized protein n=1 Tax=Saguinus oedipus TaxID=9490 RepID=A0ABQ9VI49_SAGOE|nr:hypothetical protein P7K49_014186 [Saguinus oedipus]